MLFLTFECLVFEIRKINWFAFVLSLFCLTTIESGRFLLEQFLYEQFYNNIDAQIWCKIFSTNYEELEI